MNKLIQQLIKERRVTLFLAAVIAIMGCFAYHILPRQESPDVSAAYAMIVTVYPGASPVDVKDLVTKKIEDELVELDGFDEVDSISKEGLSIIIVKFHTYVDEDKALQDVRNAVSDVQADLPDGCWPSEVDTDLIDTAGIIISLSGEDYTYEQLASFGELFEDKLAVIPGISKFSIEGKLDKEVKVDVDIGKLNQLGISIADVNQILQAQNLEIPSGSIDYGNTEITVKTPGIYTSLDDIRDTIIGVSPETGAVTKLSDIADVYMGLEDNVEKYKQNGKNAVLLTGYFQDSKNVVIVGKDVRKAIDEVKATLPEDLIVEEVVYQPDDVAKSVNDFMLNLVEGVILVIVVVFLGMGLRNALVVSTAIPLSILITFCVMYLMGIKIHQMSLTALIVALAAFIFTIIVLMPQLPSEFFPYADKNIFYVEIDSEFPTDMDATEKLTDDVVNLLSEEPEITSYTVAIGTGMPKFYITMEPAKPSPDYGQMVCKFDLGDKKTRRFKNNTEFVDYIQKRLDGNISNGKTTVRLLANAEPIDAKVIVRISGDNLDRLREVADKLKEAVAKIPGTSNVRHNMKDKTFQLEVNVDKDKASSFGITQYDIQRQVNMVLYGSDASVYRREGNEYNILLQGNISDVATLENLEIKSSVTGNKVPLKQFTTVEFGNKLDQINTFNRKQTVELLANELSGYSPSDIENTIENEILPKIDTSGTTISFAGEREDIKDNFSIVGILAALCIFIIYIILLIQFNSFVQPIVILLTVPLSLIGSVAGLYLFHNPLSLTAFLGIIALIGLVVKNGILLIEYINDARKQGYSIEEACIDAVDKRFNAIILSAATTVMGLVPLALSGSSLFGPMAISLMFGLTVSTFLTMVVIPVVYSIFEGFIENWKSRRNMQHEATAE